MLAYIKNKIVNNIAFAAKTVKVASLLRAADIVCIDSGSFCFDFSDATTHLGDRLFFIPLMKALAEKGYDLRISQHDTVTEVLLRKIIGVSPVGMTDLNASDCIIFPAPSFSNLNRKYKKGVLVDFTDTACSQKVTMQLIDSVNQFFDLNLKHTGLKKICVNDNSRSSFGLSIDQEYWLFSNYIDSGRFRKLFLNENKLVKKAEYIKSKGFNIIHVGSKADADKDGRKYEFVDIDLRGKTSISEMIDLVQLPSVVGAITYDNFLMHLMGIYGKVAYVLFRGRFSRKNREHHMLHVNNTFFDQRDKLIYL